MNKKDSLEMDFKQEIANFIFTSKYARYNHKLGRRETWEEACNRVLTMHLKKFKDLDQEYRDEIIWAFDMVKERKVVPSMRAMQFGGIAVEAHQARIYNCAVRHVDSIRAFAEIFYLLLCGCGVGIGVFRYFLNRLPDLVDQSNKTGSVIAYPVEDNIEGWSDSIEALLSSYFKNTALTGRKIVFDYTRIRPAGAPLKTGGGKAPGYKGLKKAHEKIKALLDYIIEEKNQKRLLPINAYDILMHTADAVLSGGVRRSATCIIFDKDDEQMLNAKTDFEVQKKTRFSFDDDTQKYYGRVTVYNKVYEIEISKEEYNYLDSSNKISWTHIEPQRARSNNSVLLLRDKVTKKEFEDIINKTKQYGEPGFVFGSHEWQLFNPCFEIGFIPVTKDGVCGVQFCNLSSINGAKIKTKDDFIQASKASSILGTLQATYTHFPYLNRAGEQLTKEEALLGVSITGIMDSPDILLNKEYQQEAAHKSIVTNKKWAKILGINEAARVTCVKPEGTSSLALGSASGIHPHHARRYFRRVQCNKLDNVYRFFKEHNPHMTEESKWSANKTDDVVCFPLIISDDATIKKDLTAIQHLKIIRETQENWVVAGTSSVNKKPIAHNVSCTVIVKEAEWTDIIEYIYKHREYFGAVSFIPEVGDKIYPQAPLEAIITEEDEKLFKDIIDKYQTVDYKKLKEDDDTTELVKESACSGGQCELF